MNLSRLVTDHKRPIIAYTTAVALCMVIVTLALKLWEADITVPFTYDGDANMFGMYIKGMMDNGLFGWFLSNQWLGAPWGANLSDYPNASNLDCLIIKIITLISSNYGMAYNIFFILTFPLVTLTAMFTLRQLKVSYGTSIVISLLYTFMPYHFLRGEPHIFFSAYYLVPLGILLAIWVYSREDLLFVRDEGTGRMRMNFRSPAFIFATVVCLLISCTMGYYVVFTCFFILLSGIVSSIMRCKRYPFLLAAVLILIIAAGFAVNLMPTILYHLEYGNDMQVAHRTVGEAEMYGLKIIQLLLPIQDHRIAAFAYITGMYDRYAPLVNENALASLGIVGSIGFLILLGLLLVRKTPDWKPESLERYDILVLLSILNVFAIFLCTIGGFGDVVTFVLPMLRGYNRISIFIAFFSLITIAFLLDALRQKLAGTGTRRALFCGILALVLVLGVLDQTTPAYVPNYSQNKAEFTNDAQFVASIQAIMPENAMIFQLPYMQFPESMPTYGMLDSSPLKGYLHSTDLRWSYGSIVGRAGDQWVKNVSSMPAGDMVRTISLAGFSGIYVDTYGYADNATNLSAELSSILGTSPLISNNGRLMFFDMTIYNDKLKAVYTPEEQEKARDNVLNVSAFSLS